MKNNIVLFLVLLTTSITAQAKEFDQACLSRLSGIVETSKRVEVDGRRKRVTIFFNDRTYQLIPENGNYDSLLSLSLKEVKRGRSPIGAILKKSDGLWATLTVPFYVDEDETTMSCVTFKIKSHTSAKDLKA